MISGYSRESGNSLIIIFLKVFSPCLRFAEIIYYQCKISLGKKVLALN